MFKNPVDWLLATYPLFVGSEHFLAATAAQEAHLSLCMFVCPFVRTQLVFSDIFATLAICITCNLQHVQFATPAI